MSITINVDLRPARKLIEATEAQHYSVVKSTVNSLAYLANQELKKQADTRFDKGARPFTKRGFVYTKAKAAPSGLESRLIILPKQAQYMKAMLYGDTFRPQNNVLLKPIFRNLPPSAQDQFGNLKKSRFKALANQKTTFFVDARKDKSGLRSGLYRRKGRGKNQTIEKLVQFQTYRTRKPKFPAGLIVQKVVAQNLEAVYLDKWRRIARR